jgi:hypothetical protein
MADWVDIFSSIESDAVARGESDYPLAMRLFRESVARGEPYPKEWEWCSEIYLRVAHDRPPVTETEYEELKAWYFKHESDVYDGSIRDEFINTYTRGPRRIGVTGFIAKLRRLRAAHPELA